MPRLLEFLRRYEPDVVCVQETKVGPGDFPAERLLEAGYHVAAHSTGQWGGVAMLTRAENRNVVRGLPGEPHSDEARWVEATVSGLRIVSVYVPNGRAVGHPAFADKLAFLEAAERRIRELSSGPLVVAGDFNVAPADLDAHGAGSLRGATHVSGEERDRLAAILDAGMVDAYRLLRPREVAYTWWDYRAGSFDRGIGMRIDLVLLSANLAETVCDVEVAAGFRRPPKPSDHAPVLVDLYTQPPLRDTQPPLRGGRWGA